MNKAFFAAAVFFAATGTIFLVFQQQRLVLNKQISELTQDDLGQRVLVAGFITASSLKSGNRFLKICEGAACVQVSVFASTLKRFSFVSLEKGKWLKVIGKVSEFDGDLQVTAEELD